jgi:DNA-binding Lrp family transcriptional regulator
MLNAFVLLNTNTGSEADVLRELRQMESIEEALLVYGSYDIVARLKSRSLEELKRTVTWKIRKMEYVTATNTIVIP